MIDRRKANSSLEKCISVNKAELEATQSLAEATNKAFEEMKKVFSAFLNRKYGPLLENSSLPSERIRDYFWLCRGVALISMAQAMSFFNEDSLRNELISFANDLEFLSKFIGKLGIEGAEEVAAELVEELMRANTSS